MLWYKPQQMSHYHDLNIFFSENDDGEANKIVFQL